MMPSTRLFPHVLAASILAVLVSRAGLAQAPATGLSGLHGSVIDSIHGVPLTEAVVVVEGTNRSSITGADGRFRIDSVPPGAHRISVMHPLLDTLGVPMRTGEFKFVEGTTHDVELAVPSGERLAAALCTPAWRQRFGPAIVMGFVKDPDTNGPATGAKVEVVYTGTDIIGRKLPPTSRSAIVDSVGYYHICGLPEDMSGKVQVFRNEVRSGEVPIEISNLIAVRGFSVAAHQVIAEVTSDSGKTVRVAKGTAKVTGRITDKLGRPLENARVMLQGGATMAVSKANGEYTLDSLPSGTQAIVVRRLGFGITEAAVELASNTTTRADVKMADFVPTIEKVTVEAQRNQGLDRVGYLDRKKMGFGYFLDGDRINNNALDFADIMRTAPSLKVSPAGDGRSYVIQDARSVNGCVSFFLDGAPFQTITPGDISDVVRPSEVVAVEVYNGTSTPPQFSMAGQSSCASVVIWTVARVGRGGPTKK